MILISLSVASGVQAVTITVPGTSTPWLAGMPNGTTLAGDIAPTNSPVQVSGLSLIPGQTLNFSVTGAVNNNPGSPPPTATPDGVTSLLTWGPHYGISQISNGRLNSLLGVFLDNSQPDSTPAPAALDFSSIGINFSSLAPQLKQVFFIGDGLTGTGSGAVQNFIVPSGATRLFLGPLDYGTYNNAGSFTVTVEAVPEPSTIFGLGILGLGAFCQRKLSQGKKSKQDN
ncbi:MAG: PEP-CTERM sorting domain-containing protein [Microcystis sp. LE19-84.1B]|uniref:PEP-CTERM sorting domain-containing protein n=1 Tax=Microcystis sp. LE19-84.1B TaxID=3016438 RepID=UPI0022C170CA|nr:PEP-CTERM sorting domain-containing protein [Microcystis sp. LE19-84.1B]MCZ8227016.1 PEP-CTERM sorting domain-containing protein [Microcystis sp. LE19-84.1B]